VEGAERHYTEALVLAETLGMRPLATRVRAELDRLRSAMPADPGARASAEAVAADAAGEQ
jgi:hypothetical protein